MKRKHAFQQDSSRRALTSQYSSKAIHRDWVRCYVMGRVQEKCKNQHGLRQVTLKENAPLLDCRRVHFSLGYGTSIIPVCCLSITLELCESTPSFMEYFSLNRLSFQFVCILYLNGLLLSFWLKYVI